MPMYYYETSIGKIGISEQDGYIKNVYFETDTVPENVEVAETEALREAAKQLHLYLAGELNEFTLKLAPEGTAFMRKVWECLCEIPYGKTASYGEIAAHAGNSKASRAVGLANNRNPIPIFIPCHRVVGANGSMTGYRGGIPMKEKLIALEKGKV
ncbi:methylated-DNA--[protein]-cysteine S-methyltransferase [Paenibacillus marinisediminis]